MKFFLTLLLTPAVEPLVYMIESEDKERQVQLRHMIQFYLVIALMVMSVAIKAFREDYANNFSPDPFEQKFFEFHKKYSEIEEREKNKGKNAKPIRVPKTKDPFGTGKEGEEKMKDF